MSSRTPSPWRTGNSRVEARLDLLRAASDAAAPPPGTQPTAKATRASYGWANWYINRGHIGLSPTKKELRALSWRRKK